MIEVNVRGTHLQAKERHLLGLVSHEHAKERNVSNKIGDKSIEGGKIKGFEIRNKNLWKNCSFKLLRRSSDKEGERDVVVGIIPTLYHIFGVRA